MAYGQLLTTNIIREIASLQNISAEWTQLCEKCSRAGPFQRPEWLLPWLEAFKPQDLCVVELRRGRELVGLAPMFAYHWDACHILAPLGAGITDYLDWLILPELAREGIAHILIALHEMNQNWERMDLPDLPHSSALLEHSEIAFKCTGQEICPAVLLCSESGSDKRVIPTGQRKNLRTARNRIRKAGGATVEIARLDTLPEFLDALFRLHTTRWRALGMPGVLSEVAIQKFHRRSAPELLRAGILRLYGLRFRGELIAVLHTLWGRDSAFCYLHGFDPAYAFFSPGMQIIAALIEDAAAQGKTVVDFLRGSEAYKYAWGARDTVTCSLQLSRRTLVQELCQMRAA
jgi:CelD/BcsL family acetyltransferase involved in cellulose biosynthesis